MDFATTLKTIQAITNFTPIRVGHNNYKCLCPAHDDIGPSLSVAKARRGDFALLYCHAGCDYGVIRAAIDNEFCVSPWNEEKAKQNWQVREVVTKYTYYDANGKPLFRKIRYEPKSFGLEHLANKRWQPGINGLKPVLYNLPKIIQAGTVFIVEGEKGADKLSEWGVTTTCSYNGASKSDQNPKWQPEYNFYLINKHIILLPDNDDPGFAHMQFIYDSLDHVKSKKICRLPGLAPKADIYDWIEAGYTLNDLRTLWLNTD